MRARPTLFVGALLWLGALALMPAEIAAGRARSKPGPRTFGVVGLALVAAVLVLHGLPRRSG